MGLTKSQRRRKLKAAKANKNAKNKANQPKRIRVGNVETLADDIKKLPRLDVAKKVKKEVNDDDDGESQMIEIDIPTNVQTAINKHVERANEVRRMIETAKDYKEKAQALEQSAEKMQIQTNAAIGALCGMLLEEHDLADRQFSIVGSKIIVK